jgi:hypothetical protein
MFSVFDCLQGPLGFVTEVFLLLREAQNIPLLSGDSYYPWHRRHRGNDSLAECVLQAGGRTARKAAGPQPRLG